MSKSSFVDFNTVKKSVTIVQILEHYGLTSTLTQKGDSYSGRCPIHNGDNRTQFRVSISKNCWNCFGSCKRGGNILDFVSLKEGVSIREAALKIQQWFGVESSKPEAKSEETSPAPNPKPEPTPDRDPEPDNKTANPPLTFSLQHLDPKHSYLAERGLSEETIVTFGLGFCKKGLLAGRIAIPIHNPAGELVAYAGRWPGQPSDDTPKYKLPAGFKKSLELFNIHRAIQQPPEATLVIVEGYFDCIKLWQHGVKRVVALMGSTLSPAQEELIREHTTANTRVVVMLDEDDAGRAARDDLAARLAKFCFVKTWQFDEPGTQPEQLFAEDLAEILEGLP